MPKSRFANDEERKAYDKVTSAAYNAAHTRLRESHREEYEGYYAEECEKRGVEWKPRLSPERKAEQELRELLDKFPHLRERLMEEQPSE